MEFLQIVGLGLIATFISMVLRDQKPSFAFLIAMITGIIIFLFVIDHLIKVIYVLQKIVFQAEIDILYLETVLKIIGISYITEFAAQISRDAGEGSIASRIELAGKVLIMIMAIPIIQAIIETVINLIPT